MAASGLLYQHPLGQFRFFRSHRENRKIRVRKARQSPPRLSFYSGAEFQCPAHPEHFWGSETVAVSLFVINPALVSSTSPGNSSVPSPLIEKTLSAAIITWPNWKKWYRLHRALPAFMEDTFRADRRFHRPHHQYTPGPIAQNTRQGHVW